MIIRPYNSTTTPSNMAISAFDQCPNFSISTRKFGHESGFWKNNAQVTKAQLSAKGNNLFKTGTAGATPNEKFLTVTESYVEGQFNNNQDAYNCGFGLASNHKYMFLDFEGIWGNLADYTTRQRTGHFLKGAQDNGALVGEFLYDVWNSSFVYSPNARNQLINPTNTGISNKVVEELNNTPMGLLYGLTKAIGYGSNYVNTFGNLDPRTAIYNFVYKMRVHAAQKAAGIVPANSNPIGFLWGGCDSFNTGKPPFRQRIYLEEPLNGHIWINNHGEESLKIMKGFTMWALFESLGVWYWNPQILSSDKRNDVIDILYSGFNINERGYDGSSQLPSSRPEPPRTYPFLDGLSNEAVWQMAYEFSQIEYFLDGGIKYDANFSFKRDNATNYTAIVKPTDRTSICDANDNRTPIVNKIVKGSEVLFIVQDPGANEGQITKIKASQFGKTFFMAASSDEPKLYKFSV